MIHDGVRFGAWRRIVLAGGSRSRKRLLHSQHSSPYQKVVGRGSGGALPDIECFRVERGDKGLKHLLVDQPDRPGSLYIDSTYSLQ